MTSPQRLEYERDYRAKHPAKMEAKRVKWRTAHPEEYAAYHRARAATSASRYHGFTYAQILEFLRKQGGVCAICEVDNPGKSKWHGDHDHTTGKFRGVLCGRCNMGLGLFKDNLTVMGKAIIYLQATA